MEHRVVRENDALAAGYALPPPHEDATRRMMDARIYSTGARHLPEGEREHCRCWLAGCSFRLPLPLVTMSAPVDSRSAATRTGPVEQATAAAHLTAEPRCRSGTL